MLRNLKTARVLTLFAFHKHIFFLHTCVTKISKMWKIKNEEFPPCLILEVRLRLSWWKCEKGWAERILDINGQRNGISGTVERVQGKVEVEVIHIRGDLWSFGRSMLPKSYLHFLPLLILGINSCLSFSSNPWDSRQRQALNSCFFFYGDCSSWNALPKVDQVVANIKRCN